MSLRLVCFDVWDTLFILDAFYGDVAAELAGKFGGSPMEWRKRLLEAYQKVRTIRRRGGFRDSTIVAMALKAVSGFLGLAPEAIAEAISRAVEHSDSRKYVVDGAYDVLRLVRDFDLRTAIIGNVVFWPGSHNRVLLERAGLAKFFDRQFYADEVGVSKPKPSIFKQVLSAFNVEPGEALHVGDSLFEDFAGAVLAGMNAVLIDESVKEEVKLSSWNAYIIPSLKKLENILKTEIK
ncbi:HAD family hydrolase [Candidatus Bathyarchaeota archaeon]|nr:HAD family hydrolase [Candidatus Bathyarchaeota archaeon]